MKLDFMQTVDFWFGRPLCFLATVIEKTVPFLISVANSNEPPKVLFIELSEMGAAIVAAPAIKLAIQKYGKENVFFLIFLRNRESIEIQNILDKDNILVIRDKSFLDFCLSTSKILLKIRSLRFSAVFDLELFSRCTALLTWLSGAKYKVGFSSGPDEGPYRGNLFTRDFRYNSHIHMALNFIALVKTHLAENDTPYQKDVAPELPEAEKYDASPAVVSKLKEKLQLCSSYKIDFNKPIILLNPDAGSLPLRGWPVDNWINLAQQLESEYQESNIIIVGLKSYVETSRALIEKAGSKRIINFCGETKDLAEFTSLMSFSTLIVTCDSGPAHFASLVDLPCIVLFGPETPDLYKPLGKNVTVLFKKLMCSPCYSAYNHRQSVCTDNLCMKTIALNEVTDNIKQILNQIS